MYDFHKISKHSDNDENEWRHPCFIRGQVEKLAEIKRKIPDPPSQRTQEENGVVQIVQEKEKIDQTPIYKEYMNEEEEEDDYDMEQQPIYNKKQNQMSLKQVNQTGQKGQEKMLKKFLKSFNQGSGKQNKNGLENFIDHYHQNNQDLLKNLQMVISDAGSNTNKSKRQRESVDLKLDQLQTSHKQIKNQAKQQPQEQLNDILDKEQIPEMFEYFKRKNSYDQNVGFPPQNKEKPLMLTDRQNSQMEGTSILENMGISNNKNIMSSSPQAKSNGNGYDGPLKQIKEEDMNIQQQQPQQKQKLLQKQQLKQKIKHENQDLQNQQLILSNKRKSSLQMLDPYNQKSSENHFYMSNPFEYTTGGDSAINGSNNNNNATNGSGDFPHNIMFSPQKKTDIGSNLNLADHSGFDEGGDFLIQSPHHIQHNDDNNYFLTLSRNPSMEIPHDDQLEHLQQQQQQQNNGKYDKQNVERKQQSQEENKKNGQQQLKQDGDNISFLDAYFSPTLRKKNSSSIYTSQPSQMFQVQQQNSNNQKENSNQKDDDMSVNKYLNNYLDEEHKQNLSFENNPFFD